MSRPDRGGPVRPFHAGPPGVWQPVRCETGFAGVTYDLISVQYHSLKAGHDYGQYVRDAENAGLDDVAGFFREVMEQDSQRAKRCHGFLKRLESTEHGVNV